jgi:hypothetical protein
VLIEKELQSRYDAMKPNEYLSIMSADVARTIGQNADKVGALIFRIDTGHNGVTFHKPADESE